MCGGVRCGGQCEVCVGSGRCVEQEGSMGDVLKDGVCACVCVKEWLVSHTYKNSDGNTERVIKDNYLGFEHKIVREADAWSYHYQGTTGQRRGW